MQQDTVWGFLSVKRPLKTAIAFLACCLIMKVAGEIVHEVLGHGLFTILLGGRVLDLGIRLLWPLESSYIVCQVPNSTLAHQVLILSAGIAMSLVVFFLSQAILLSRDLKTIQRMSLFWLSFWTFISSISYLIGGIIAPTGDVQLLIQLGVISRLEVGLMGFALLPPGMYLLTRTLQVMFSEIVSPVRIRGSMMAFWGLMPVPLVMAAAGGIVQPFRPPPVVGGSALLLLSALAYLVATKSSILLSRYDPREKFLIRMRQGQ